MLCQQLTPVAQWYFENGWPMKVMEPELRIDSNVCGVEELTVVREGTTRVK